jgi:hypothetical protein
MKLTKEHVETYLEKPYNASIPELCHTIIALYVELEDIRDAHIRVMSEQCPTDEVHCACVPILRRERARIVGMLKEWKRHKDIMSDPKSVHYSMCIEEILDYINLIDTHIKGEIFR